jgi:hypothetical protein
MEISGYLIVSSDIIKNNIINSEEIVNLLKEKIEKYEELYAKYKSQDKKVSEYTTIYGGKSPEEYQNIVNTYVTGTNLDALGQSQKCKNAVESKNMATLFRTKIKNILDGIGDEVTYYNGTTYDELKEQYTTAYNAYTAGNTSVKETMDYLYQAITQRNSVMARYTMAAEVLEGLTEAYENNAYDAYVLKCEQTYLNLVNQARVYEAEEINLMADIATLIAEIKKLYKILGIDESKYVTKDENTGETSYGYTFKLENFTAIDLDSMEIKLDQNKMFLDGKRTSRTDVNEYIFRLSARYKVKAQVPDANAEYTTYDSDGSNVTKNQYTTETYDQFVSVTRAVKMICDDNLDIISHDAFEAVLYHEGITIPIKADTLKGMTVVNLIDLSDIQYGDIKKVTDTALEEISKVQLPELDWANMFRRKGGNYADIYLSPDFSVITNGYVATETAVSDTGVPATKQVWKGDYPLDRLIYTIQSNLDILMANQRIKGDVYGNLYATLMAQAIQSATVLEQARLQAYEQASQFQVKTMVEYYLGAINAKLSVIKTLAEVQTQFLQKAVYQAQIKLYNVQTHGFKANNINKLFTAQLDGASTAYTAGMLDIPPACYNNADLMGLYTDLSNNMSVL